jgi:hypothetical protein
MTIGRLAAVLACTMSVACGSGSSTAGPPTSPTPPPPPAQTGGINGVAIDAISDRPLPGATIEPNAFDRDGAKFAFQRPPLNRSPDIDPDPFTGNF